MAGQETKAPSQCNCKGCKITINKGEVCYFTLKSGWNGYNYYCEECQQSQLDYEREQAAEDFLDTNFY